MEASTDFPYVVKHEGRQTLLDPKTAYIQLKLHLLQKGEKKIQQINTNQHILIVLDKSGSMSGSPIENSLKGIDEMVTFFYQNKLHNITFITYESNATIHDFQGMSLDEQKKFLSSVRGGGGTSFRAAFDRIIESVTKRESNDVKVIFFTDGEDGSAKGNIGYLAEFFKKVPLSEFHTIGFRENHDVDLLNSITKIGSRPGTFQYCKDSKDIQTCVESVSGLIACASFINATVINGKHETALELDAHHDEEASTKEYHTTLFHDLSINGSEFKIKFTAGTSEQIHTVSLSDLKVEDESSTNPVFLRLYLIKHKIGEALTEALNLRNEKGNLDKELCDKLVQEVLENNKKLDELSEEAAKLPTKEKKTFFPTLFETKDLVTEFYSKLKDFQSGLINNDKVAALNALAYRKVTKKGLQRKLDARTQNNVGVINKVYDTVKDITSKLDYNDLTQKYAKLAEQIGSCVYSANNFIEALKEDDCLCLTFDVGRSQAAIMDPTQIVIKDIFPTVMTVQSFMFSAEYALKANSEAHGGFDKGAQGEIIKGVARESITGVLPLYICPENWKVAKQLMKPALGWTVTLDPLGYAYNQVKTVPFLILCKLYSMPKSEFVDMQIRLVEETCMEIIKDGSNPKNEIRIDEETNKQFDAYLKDPLSRTVDVIPSNQVFMTTVLLMSRMGMLKLPDKDSLNEFFMCLMEEEMRRYTLTVEPTFPINVHILKILNVNIEEVIDKPIAAKIEEAQGKGTITGYAEKFIAALGKDYKEDVKKEGKEKPTVEKVEVKEEEYSLNRHGAYNETQLQALSELRESRKRASKVVNLRQLFGLPASEDKFELNPDTEWTVLALYCQNKITSKNADRREYITSKQYRDPFRHGKDYIIWLRDCLIEREKTNRLTAALSNLANDQNTKTASIFAKTENLYEAAGAFMGSSVGRNVRYFADALCQPNVPHIAEKIKMLEGEYMGVSLLTDRGGAFRWHFGFHTGNKILRTHYTKFDGFQWKKILPMVKSEYIDRVMKGQLL